jgi:hypothetical protein
MHAQPIGQRRIDDGVSAAASVLAVGAASVRWWSRRKRRRRNMRLKRSTLKRGTPERQ